MQNSKVSAIDGINGRDRQGTTAVSEVGAAAIVHFSRGRDDATALPNRYHAHTDPHQGSSERSANSREEAAWHCHVNAVASARPVLYRL